MPHILGLSDYTIHRENSHFTGKMSGLFNALDAHYTVIDVVQPHLRGLARQVNRALSFHPKVDYWRVLVSANPHAFRARSRVAGHLIDSQPEPVDLVFQNLAIFAPGLDFHERPYVVMTDNTHAIAERHWPDWAPYRTRREHEAFMALEQDLFHHARVVFTHSHFARNSIINDYGTPADRVVVTGVGSGFTPPAEYDPLPGRYASQRALFVGYDFERKGGDHLLEAWQSVRKALPDATLQIVGPEVPSAPATQGVQWLGRITDRDRLRRIFDEAACFVMPSLFEPYGLAFIEAMSLGLACVAPEGYGVADIIRSGENGYLVPVGKADPIADALIALLGDPAAAESMGRQARTDTLNYARWDLVVERMRPHLEAALNRN
ncbi:MAG: glycosyltransferase family 4 protein [Chloroflexi bacterium]|nr:glycosyltransferase family 4 protein [Chloroflexota bacterium]